MVLARARSSPAGRNWKGGTFFRKVTTLSVTAEFVEVCGETTGLPDTREF
jgi:hypothetical protein